MAWIQLTEQHLVAAISGRALETYRSKGLQEQQADPVQPSIDLVTATVRGAVIANPRNQVGPAGTIPDALLQAAVALTVWQIMQRIGSMQDPGGSRKDAVERAEELLRKVSEGKWSIEAPADATPVVRSTPRGQWGGAEKLAI